MSIETIISVIIMIVFFGVAFSSLLMYVLYKQALSLARHLSDQLVEISKVLLVANGVKEGGADAGRALVASIKPPVGHALRGISSAKDNKTPPKPGLKLTVGAE